MRIDYQLTEEDYIVFNVFHVQHSKTAKKSLQLQRYLFPLMLLVISYFFAEIGRVPFSFSFFSFLAVGLLWFFFYPKFFYNSIRKQASKMIKEGKNEGLLGAHTVYFQDEGLTEITSTGETKVSWTGIQLFQETEDYFYLYNSAVSAFIIPKRAVEDISAYRTYLQKYIQ